MTAKIEFLKRDRTYIKRNYERGTGIRALAEEFGVSMGVITRVLSELGVEMRAKGRPFGSKDSEPRPKTSPHRDDVIRMRDDEDMSFTEIGASLGISRQNAHGLYWSA